MNLLVNIFLRKHLLVKKNNFWKQKIKPIKSLQTFSAYIGILQFNWLIPLFTSRKRIGCTCSGFCGSQALSTTCPFPLSPSENFVIVPTLSHDRHVPHHWPSVWPQSAQTQFTLLPLPLFLFPTMSLTPKLGFFFTWGCSKSPELWLLNFPLILSLSKSSPTLDSGAEAGSGSRASSLTLTVVLVNRPAMTGS